MYGAWLKYLRYGISMFANDLNILNIATMCVKQLKYLKKGFTLSEMTEEFDKRLIYVGNDVYMLEMA